MAEEMEFVGRKLTLRVLEGGFAICRIPPGDEIPPIPTDSGRFWSLSQTTDELTLVCPEEDAVTDARAETGWRVLKIEGVFPFTESGVLSSVLSPLGEAGVGIFAISTFDTDYVMVKEANLARAVDVLQKAGHVVE